MRRLALALLILALLSPAGWDEGADAYRRGEWA